MRLLLDDNISYRIVKKISESFPDCLHASRIGTQRPAPDRTLWEFARREGLVIVTFDEDFEDLHNLYGFPPKVIILRLGNSSTDKIAQVLVSKQIEISAFYASETYGLLEIF
jgi:predicted nuclease of predicted toxin-antitoxin system